MSERDRVLTAAELLANPDGQMTAGELLDLLYLDGPELLQEAARDLRPAAAAITDEIARLLGLGEPGEVVAFPGSKR